MADDLDAGGSELKLRMEYPFARSLGRLFVPARRSDQIDSSIAIDIAMADPMADPTVNLTAVPTADPAAKPTADLTADPKAKP